MAGRIADIHDLRAVRAGAAAAAVATAALIVASAGAVVAVVHPTLQGRRRKIARGCRRSTRRLESPPRNQSLPPNRIVRGVVTGRREEGVVLSNSRSESRQGSTAVMAD